MMRKRILAKLPPINGFRNLTIGLMLSVVIIIGTLAFNRLGFGAETRLFNSDLTIQIALVLLMIAAAMLLFFFEWVPADVTALGILIFLVLTGLLPDEEAFAGFGSETVMMILGLFILTAALLRTGVVDLSARAILRYTGDNPNRLLNVVMWNSAILGAFISNTASTAFFLPIVIGLAHRVKVSASKLLMPLAFASILTSSVTLVSTSTNIVVSGLMTRYDQPAMGMFELAPVGIPISILGLVYMHLVGIRLIPDRAQSNDLTNVLGIRQYLTEVLILPDSPLIGKTLAESRFGQDMDLTILRLIRDGDRHLIPRANRRLKSGDTLLVQGQRDDILKLKDTAGVDIKADVELSDSELQSEDIRLVEVIILPKSPLIGRTLKQHRFRERYHMQVLAIFRHGETIREKISRIRLKMGDILLVQGHPANIAALEENNRVSVIGAIEKERSNISHAPIAIATFIGVLVLATFNTVSLPTALLLGALVVFLTGTITPERAYQEVDWRALILIGSMLGLGAAMEQTGTSAFLAKYFVDLLGNSNPTWLLTAFFALAVLLTQPMSNQAAAIVVVPIAMQTALRIGLNPRTFAMMIAVAASTSYLTPLEPACLMVYGPGGYRFVDFLKVGGLLTVLIYIVAIILVPILWPLSAG